jgi:hypothetical protein
MLGKVATTGPTLKRALLNYRRALWLELRRKAAIEGQIADLGTYQAALVRGRERLASRSPRRETTAPPPRQLSSSWVVECEP